jgi:site-specific DNA-methyltransferase (adenine-specific)
MISKVLFSSLSPHWNTPGFLYVQLKGEFHFNDDPCPSGGIFGLDRSWGTSTFCNPPYGRRIGEWIEKGIAEWRQGKMIVFLLPARTDTKWFHNLVLPNANEIRFIRGRLRFIGQDGRSGRAPFPSMIIVFRHENAGARQMRDLPSPKVSHAD